MPLKASSFWVCKDCLQSQIAVVTLVACVEGRTVECRYSWQGSGPRQISERVVSCIRWSGYKLYHVLNRKTTMGRWQWSAPENVDSGRHLPPSFVYTINFTSLNWSPTNKPLHVSRRSSNISLLEDFLQAKSFLKIISKKMYSPWERVLDSVLRIEGLWWRWRQR